MRLRLIALTMLFCASAHAEPSYSEGWTNGWKEGWRVTTGDYFVPFPPFPQLGHDSYKEGFAEGVLQGAEAARCRH